MSSRRDKVDIGADKQVIKGLSLIGTAEAGSPAVVDVKNGRITRIRPLDYEWKYDKQDFNVWKMEARGNSFGPPMHAVLGPIMTSYKKRVYSKNRVRYPLKRVDWDPNGAQGSTGPGGRNTQNRGTSKYVRITWDEAAEIVASELKRVGTTYGPEAVLSQSDGHCEGKHLQSARGCMGRLLSLLGGYTIQMRNLDSWEGWVWGGKHVWGCEPVGEMTPMADLYPDIAQHTDLLLFWGCDPETTAHAINGQMASRLCYWLSEIGIKSVYVCPDLNYGAAVHADKWIPVLPNTDAALHLAIAYVWLTEGTYDKEYIATHAYGFDKFQAYVLGEEDGEPKTPAWASEKCGVPEWTIKALARDWAKKVTSIVHGNGGPGIRGPYSTEPGRLEPMLLGMRGLGKPGVHQAKMIEWPMFTEHAPLPYQGKIQPVLPHFADIIPPARGLSGQGLGAYTPKPHTPELNEWFEAAGLPPTQFIPKCLVPDAILHPPISWWGMQSFFGPASDQFVKHTFPREGCSEIHMVWTDSPCWTTCWNDTNSFIEAMRQPSIECIVAQHPWLENDCLLADVILPVATKFELDDIGNDIGSGVFTSMYLENQAVDPVGESLGDFDVVIKIAEKLGLRDEVAGKLTSEQMRKLAFEWSGVHNLVSWEEFKAKEYFVIPCDNEEKTPGLRGFYEDPAANPLTTPTGLLEYSCTALEEHFPDDPERPPVAQWIETGESHDERLSSERTKDYPLLCMSNHPHWRMHAQADDITWTREIQTMKLKGPDGYMYEPVWIHPSEAKKRGIQFGDLVKIFNERGVVLGGAYVTERVMPQVAYMDHGARWDPIIPGEVDRGGVINTLTPHNIISKKATGMVVSGFLVEVARVTDEELAAWRRDYPEAFDRDYDLATGVSLSGWLIEP
ncbi:MAG: molybdopterin-dependent oxidoreductase [Actinobacteria bacterium]|jgi:trimethylamine-N-oxide reductase (cytochrome c)|nr:molybdopterin-dependent oxidoreductase [Actinomycetota bacterium]